MRKRPIRSENMRGEDSLNELFPPGILRVTCIPENKALFLRAFSCYFDTLDIFDDLNAGVFLNKELQQDYDKYDIVNEKGEGNFSVNIEFRGWEYLDTDTATKALENCKKNWTGKFY